MRRWRTFPIPDGPITLGLAEDSVRDWEAKQPHCEVLVGQRTLACTREEADEPPSSKRLGFVHTLDPKAQRRLHEVLTSQGLPLHQQSTCFSDGSDIVRDLQLSRSPEAEPILDGFPVAMKRTVLDHYAQRLVHGDQTLGEEMRDMIERLQWSLVHLQGSCCAMVLRGTGCFSSWSPVLHRQSLHNMSSGTALGHGHLSKAFEKGAAIASLLSNVAEPYPTCKPWRKAVEEWRTSITNNRHLIPNSGERDRHGEAIATGCVASMVHQVVRQRCCKQQQMRWSTRGAHWLLQTRVKILNRALSTVCKRWYPDMEVEELPEVD